MLTNVPYTTVSDYLPLPAGSEQVTVYATGDTTTPVIDAHIEVAAGNAYTVAAVGLVADGSLTANVYEDDLSAPLRWQRQGARRPRLTGRWPG